jgi:hypothetical protein
MKNEYDNKNRELSQTTALSEEENPIEKFYRIKNEINLIESDIQYYEKNVNRLN